MKNYPLKSFRLTGFGSWRVNFLHPDKTIFLAISIPKAPAPLKNMLAAAYLATASTPIAPIYLLHLSFTASSSIFKTLSFLLLESIWLSSPTSISSKTAWPSEIYFSFFYLFCAALLCYLGYGRIFEMSEGFSSLFSVSSNWFTTSVSISLYFVLVYLNWLHQWSLWSFTRPVYAASFLFASSIQWCNSFRISNLLT